MMLGLVTWSGGGGHPARRGALLVLYTSVAFCELAILMLTMMMNAGWEAGCYYLNSCLAKRSGI